MVCQNSFYPLIAENLYGSHPRQCVDSDVLHVGAGLGLACVPYELEQAHKTLGRPLHVTVVDAGPIDMLTHMAHVCGFSRRRFLLADQRRFGGKLVNWGMSTPQPPERLLRQWPYNYDDLAPRFEAVEAEMGVPHPIPHSEGILESHLLNTLRCEFPDCGVRVAPVAINKYGERWCPLRYIPQLVKQGVRLLPRFQCSELIADGSRIVAVRGKWLDGRTYALRAKIIVLAVGVEPSIPLLRPLSSRSIRLETADHIRIDAHGSLPSGSYGNQSIDELGVAVLILDLVSKDLHIPYHLEVKVAPRALWSRGCLPSSDNLRGDDSDGTIFIQVQAVAAMHDRLPTVDLLNVDNDIPPVMSARDAEYHGEIITKMRRVAAALGLEEPRFSFRPLTTNHHLYGAYRVGKAVTEDFRWQQCENLYVLPPAAYVDLDDDANPTLKSRVLAQYAIDAMIRDLSPAITTRPNCNLIGCDL